MAQESWIQSTVRCRADYRADESPLSFLLGDREIEVRRIVSSWKEPNYLCFRVETGDGRAYELRHHEYVDSWEVRESAAR